MFQLNLRHYPCGIYHLVSKLLAPLCQRCIYNLVEDLRWSFSVKIVSGWEPFTIFTKTLHGRCFDWLLNTPLYPHQFYWAFFPQNHLSPEESSLPLSWWNSYHKETSLFTVCFLYDRNLCHEGVKAKCIQNSLGI